MTASVCTVFTFQLHSLLLSHVPNHHSDGALGNGSLGLEVCQSLVILLDDFVGVHHPVGQHIVEELGGKGHKGVRGGCEG